MILANGFEDVEAIATVDVLRRSKLDITLATVNDELLTISQSKVPMMADKLLKQLNYQTFDFLIIPGGGAVFAVLDKMAKIREIINHFVSSDKLVAAICAAPHLVGKFGHYKNHQYTCFPTCETEIIGGTYQPTDGVITSGNFITGKSMYHSIEFGLAIVEKLQGKEQRELIEKKIQGL